MIELKDFYRIRIKTRNLKKVIAVYDSLEKKGFIEFIPAGMFSGCVDIICENYILVYELQKAGIPFREKGTWQCSCVDPVSASSCKIDDSSNLACDYVTKEELSRTIASLRTGDKTKPVGISDLSKIKLQRTKITERRLLNFKLEKRRTKWELIKALQEEFDKLPDETEFNSSPLLGLELEKVITSNLSWRTV